MICHALILARGGSKGIKMKNIVDYKGQPLIVHTINISKSSDLISDTIVSTDNKQIADISRYVGANVPFIRPSNISGDLSRDYDSFIHYLNYLKENNITLPDIIVHLRPTSPDRKLSEVNTIIQTFMSPDIYNNYDSLRTVVPVNKTPFKMYMIHNDKIISTESRKKLKPLFENCHNDNGDFIEESYNAPRQVLPKCYIHDGYIDIVKTSTIINKGSMCGDTIYPYVRNIEQDDIVDIDTLNDLVKSSNKSISR